MNFLRKLTNHEIFEKVAEIAGVQSNGAFFSGQTQNKEKKDQQCIDEQTSSIKKPNQQELSQKVVLEKDSRDLQLQRDPDSEESDAFVQSLHRAELSRVQSQAEKKRKKHLFDHLEIEPIYLQSCNEESLLKMEIEFGGTEGFERTETLHSYLNQLKKAIRNVIAESEIDLSSEFFAILDQKMQAVDQLVSKIRTLRMNLKESKAKKYISIRRLILKKKAIKEKTALLRKMKEKRELAVQNQTNLDQVYFTERNRHKLYAKIANMKTLDSNKYFRNMRQQIVEISRNNIEIIHAGFKEWIRSHSKKVEFSQKSIEKLLICLFFVKSERIYTENELDYNFQGLEKRKLVPLINEVKKWKHFRYILDPSMRSKIGDFLNRVTEMLLK